MASNTGKNARKGAVKKRSQVINSETGWYVKRDAASGQFTDVKKDGRPFKSKNQHVVPTDNGWAVKGESNARNTKLFDTKEKAEVYGREIAKNQRSELVIHDKDGKIQNTNSYGNDPAFSRGITIEEIQKLSPALQKLADYDKKGEK